MSLSPEYLRRQATALTHLAEVTRDPDVAKALLRIASERLTGSFARAREAAVDKVPAVASPRRADYHRGRDSGGMNGNRLDIQASVDLEGLKKLQAHARKASEHFGNDGAVMTRPPTDGVDGPLRRSK